MDSHRQIEWIIFDLVQLVGWSLTSLFSTNMTTGIEMKDLVQLAVTDYLQISQETQRCPRSPVARPLGRHVQ